ncbi:helicase-associated domain-containing protein [Antrihabitans cavernicola]|uniref:DNA-binding protein n=1 Tax=Antrihabitans cavernicola TaxID=2495913 RepID=A0A5A7S6U9_9NOCA|nr:helicase-associated domain-containing protein [Spelaeibacter cavernicola]KAA0021224.1 DNA-binding protein [Spelaeibacter cavernicola]
MTATDDAEDDSESTSLSQWLASRSDGELLELLRLRPDLTIPLPATMDVLAGRAEQRASVMRAADELNTLALAVIEALALSGAHTDAVRRDEIADMLRGRAPAKAVTAAFEQLRARALIWGNKRLRLLPTAVDVVPWPVGRSLEPVEPMSEEQIDAGLAMITPAEQSLIERLAHTSPIGRTRDAAPGTPADRPVQRLLAAGLLIWVDEQTVELPHQVGQLLRGEPVADPAILSSPEVKGVKHKLAEVNGAAAGEALELLRHCGGILEALGDSPAPALRAGGMGVRELRRVGKRLGIDEPRVSLLVELLAAAGLLVSGRPDPSPPTDAVEDYWAPTTVADAWLDAPPSRRWAVLAGAWIDLARRPSLIGLRDANDKPIAALSDEVRSAVAPRDRRLVLSVIAELGTGESTDASTISRALAWRRPRWAHRFNHGAVQHTLSEAESIGVIGRGALSSPGRALLHGGDAEAEMDSALPPPVDYVLVQADLTVIAPGPLTPELLSKIVRVADVESAGGATVYRISETSVRRALDSGLTASELHSLFEIHSRTSIPQSLTYLIDDVSRRHGQLRAGVAESFIRCDDPALLAQVLASPVAEKLALRSLAPTVAISQATLHDVLNELRAAGFAPAGEDSSGTIVELRQRGARIAARRIRPQLRVPAMPSDEQLVSLIGELRAGERAARANRGAPVRYNGSRATGAATIALLQLAVRVRRSVSIGYVDAAGTATERIVEPIRVGGGQLEALDPATGAIRNFTLHRIAAVALVE